MRLDGPDISHHQYDAGPVDLAVTRAAGSTWFATKLTQSSGYLDPTAAKSRLTAGTLGFRCVGLYHWLSPVTDPQSQAAWFLRQLGGMRVGEFAMLDDEEVGVTVDKTLAWLEAVERVTKRPCAVYTGAFVAGGTIWTDPRVREGKYGRRPMILAAYTTEAQAKALPGVAANPWSSWQYSSSGPVPGVVGRCDMNRVDDWAVYDLACGRAPVPAHPDVIIPPKPIAGADMPYIAAAPDRNPAIIDAGYATGADPTVMAAPVFPVQQMTAGLWDELIANSNQMKARDKALAAGQPVALQVSGVFNGTAS